MLVKTEGIVLKQIPFSDSSLIARVFTREYGLVSFILKGARSPKNGKANIFKPINLLELSFYNRENKQLKNIKEFHLIFAPDSQRFGIHKSAVTMVMVELLNNTILEDSLSDSNKYDFIKDSISFLQTNALNSLFYLSFIYQYSIVLGIDILETDTIKTNTLDLLSNYQSLYHLKLSRKERKEIYQNFESHYLDNLTQFKPLKSIGVLEMVLS